MKKALSFCLALILVLAALPLSSASLSVEAASAENGYTYKVKDGEAIITKADASVGTAVVIPATLGGYPVTGIGYQAFYRREKIETIVIPEGVTEIGHQAFYYCRALKSVTLPESLITIGTLAFDQCRSLESVTLPAAVTEVDTQAFSHCEKLAAINVAAGNAVYSSQDGVLFNKDKTALLICPEGKTAETYTVPAGVTRLEIGAFYRCLGVKRIVLPASLAEIGIDAFRDCSALTAIDVAGNAVFSSKDGVLFNGDGTVLLQYPQGRDAATYAVPDGVKTIATTAFLGCELLTAVTFPNSLTEIGDEAFASCVALKELTVPASVTKIGYKAFSVCLALQSVALFPTLKTVDDAAFYGCDDLTYVYYHGDTRERAGLRIGDENRSLTGAKWEYERCTDAAGHVFDNDWDDTCNVCGSMREIEATHRPGDINGDGAVNNRDSIFLTRHLNDWKPEVVEAALDVNGDGAVNNRDTIFLTRYLNGWDVTIY